jgi:hypothetical protein
MTPRNRCRVTSRRVYTLQADIVRIPRAPGGIGRGNRPVPIPADSAENRPVPGADAGIVRTLPVDIQITLTSVVPCLRKSSAQNVAKNKNLTKLSPLRRWIIYISITSSLKASLSKTIAICCEMMLK